MRQVVFVALRRGRASSHRNRSAHNAAAELGASAPACRPLRPPGQNGHGKSNMLVPAQDDGGRVLPASSPPSHPSLAQPGLWHRTPRQSFIPCHEATRAIQPHHAAGRRSAPPYPAAIDPAMRAPLASRTRGTRAPSGRVTTAMCAELYGVERLDAVRAAVAGAGVIASALAPAAVRWLIHLGITLALVLLVPVSVARPGRRVP